MEALLTLMQFAGTGLVMLFVQFAVLIAGAALICWIFSGVGYLGQSLLRGLKAARVSLLHRSAGKQVGE